MIKSLEIKVFSNKKGSTFFHQNMLPHLVEVARVELASEKIFTRLSPSEDLQKTSSAHS